MSNSNYKFFFLTIPPPDSYEWRSQSFLNATYPLLKSQLLKSQMTAISSFRWFAPSFVVIGLRVLGLSAQQTSVIRVCVFSPTDSIDLSETLADVALANPSL